MESALQSVGGPVADDENLRHGRSDASLVAFRPFGDEVEHSDRFHMYMAEVAFFVVADEELDGVDGNVVVVVAAAVVAAVAVFVVVVVELMANRALSLVVLGVNRVELDLCDERSACSLNYLT